MTRLAFIGTGNLGSMLVRGFIKGKAARPQEINVLNRTPQKVQSLKEEFPGLCAYQDYRKLINDSDVIFICVKPGDLPSLLQETRDSFTPDKLIVSTLLAPPLGDLERIIGGKLARIYPSVIQSTGRGVTLLTWGKKIQDTDKNKLLRYLETLGRCYELPEELYRAAGDVTSCGPAFMAYMVGALARQAALYGVPEKTANEMALETMLGTALLLEEQGLTFEGLIKKVATPGGCTAEGVKVLERKLPAVIDEVYKATCVRDREITHNLREVFKLQ